MNASRPLRVLHVIDSLGEGGAEQNLLTFVKRSSAEHCEHHIAWLYDQTNLLDAFTPFTKTRFFLGSPRSVQLLSAAVKLAGHIRRVKPDVIHAELIRAQLVARIAAQLAGGVPVVVAWHSVSYAPDMLGELGGHTRMGVTRLLDAATGKFDVHTIAVSRTVAEHNSVKLGVMREHVSVVYDAVDPSRVVNAIHGPEKALLRVRLGLPAEGTMLLSVGRLVVQKDHATSILAMRDILRAQPDAFLVIAGTGGLRASLEAQVRNLGLEGRVLLLGPRRDVPDLLRVCDLFLFASIVEGLGIALTEALASGVPCVASDIPTSREVAGASDGIEFFPPSSAAHLSDAVLRILKDLPAAQARSKKAAEQICRRFSAEKMVEDTLAILRRAAERGLRLGLANAL